jgi:hypothetical protein
VSYEAKDEWEWPDTRVEPEGYDLKMVPDFTPANFLMLLEQVQEIARLLEAIKQQETQPEDQ